MATPDPEHVNFVIEHLGKIATGITVVGLMILKFFPQKREAAKLAQAVITDKTVTQVELLVLHHLHPLPSHIWTHSWHVVA